MGNSRLGFLKSWYYWIKGMMFEIPFNMACSQWYPESKREDIYFLDEYAFRGLVQDESQHLYLALKYAIGVAEDKDEDLSDLRWVIAKEAIDKYEADIQEVNNR